MPTCPTVHNQHPIAQHKLEGDAPAAPIQSEWQLTAAMHIPMVAPILDTQTAVIVYLANVHGYQRVHLMTSLYPRTRGMHNRDAAGWRSAHSLSAFGQRTMHRRRCCMARWLKSMTARLAEQKGEGGRGEVRTEGDNDAEDEGKVQGRGEGQNRDERPRTTRLGTRLVMERRKGRMERTSRWRWRRCEETAFGHEGKGQSSRGGSNPEENQRRSRGDQTVRDAQMGSWNAGCGSSRCY